MLDVDVPIRASISHVSCSNDDSVQTQYVITVVDERQPSHRWSVYRRYSEFRKFFHEICDEMHLQNFCGPCMELQNSSAIRRFPRKHLFRSKKSSVVRTRQCMLNYFLLCVAKSCKRCKSIESCTIRSLLEKFLLVSDMRYSFLGFSIEEERHEDPAVDFLDEDSAESTLDSTTLWRNTNELDAKPSFSKQNYDDGGIGNLLLTSGISRGTFRTRKHSCDDTHPQKPLGYSISSSRGNIIRSFRCPPIRHSGSFPSARVLYAAYPPRDTTESSSDTNNDAEEDATLPVVKQPETQTQDFEPASCEDKSTVTPVSPKASRMPFLQVLNQRRRSVPTPSTPASSEPQDQKPSSCAPKKASPLLLCGYSAHRSKAKNGVSGSLASGSQRCRRVRSTHLSAKKKLEKKEKEYIQKSAEMSDYMVKYYTKTKRFGRLETIAEEP